MVVSGIAAQYLDNTGVKALFAQVGISADYRLNQYSAYNTQQLERQQIITGPGANENYTGFLYHYDDVGNVANYSQDVYSRGGLLITNTYQYFDDYKLGQVKGERNNATPGITTNTYDTNGHLIQVDDSTQSTNRRTFGVDAAGHVLKKVEGNASVTHSWLVNDQVIGSGVSAIDRLCQNAEIQR